MKPRLALIMFDLDGTLADTGRDIADAVNHMRRELNLGPLGQAEVCARVGRGVEYLIRAVLPPHHIGGFAKARRLFLDHYERHLLDHTRLYPHVMETLEHFHDKKKVVVSNKLRSPTVLILEGLGIARHFDLVLGGDSTSSRKPDPEPLNQALSKYNIVPPRALIVGDDECDIRAGKSAAVRTCGVTYGLGDKKALIRSRPDRLVDDLLQIKDYFG